MAMHHDAHSIGNRTMKLFTTDSVPTDQGGAYWCRAISEAFFNLQLDLPNYHGYCGELKQWELSMGSLAQLNSAALSSRRLRRHCEAEERQVLLTIPLRGAVEFSQLGRTTRCMPGQFVLELSEEPYEFAYGNDSAMLVLKLPANAIRVRVGDPRRFSARQYDAASGIGALFNDYLKLVARQIDLNSDPQLTAVMEVHLVELLALALQEHPDALKSQQSAVRDAHLARIEAYIWQNLSDPGLTPTQVAKACRISVRYLHFLFSNTGRSVSEWIRDGRLQMAHEALQRSGKNCHVATIAYDCGFNDHPKFSHAFRKKFGYTPSELQRDIRGQSQSGLASTTSASDPNALVQGM